MTLLDSVSRTLSAAGIPHALIGASALSAAGIARSTFDVDLLVMDRRVLQSAFWDAARDEGAVIDVRVGGADDPLAGVVRLESGNERPVDVIVGRAAWQQRALDRAAVHGQGLHVVRPADLVLLKLYAGGAQDLWDVRELLRVCGSPLIESVERDLAGLPQAMRVAWARARQD